MEAGNRGHPVSGERHGVLDGESTVKKRKWWLRRPGIANVILAACAAEPPFSRFDSAFAVQNALPLTGNGMTSVARFQIVDNIPFQNELEAYIEKYKRCV